MALSSIMLFVALWASSFASGFSRQSSRVATSAVFPSSRTYPMTTHISTTVSAQSHHQYRGYDVGTPPLYRSAPALAARGGGSSDKSTTTQTQATSTPYDTGSKCPVTGAATIASSLWGTFGVLYILAKAITRVTPVALEPFKEGVGRSLTQFELGAYIVTCLWFAYVEGYKGFQQKFSPLVVKRSFTLIPGRNGTQWYHFLLAPFYSMGLMHATRKRQIVSWSLTIGIAVVVAIVKRLPYPWRNIVDAGVVVGLTWGSLSILALYLKSWMTGHAPQGVDAALPKAATTASSSSTKSE